MKKVAIIGTQGVPASYGGFETLVEHLVREKQAVDVNYTVFCSSRDLDKKKYPDTYEQAELKYVPLHANGMQSVFYDILSMIRAIRGYDAVLILGVSGCLFLPIFRLFFRKRLIINIDGLEHKREKWGKFSRAILLKSEQLAVRYADTVIADNKGIQDYVRQTYGLEAKLIAYGGDHVKRNPVPESEAQKLLSSYGLTPHAYAVTVCRIEPENNCHLILEAFSRTDKELVFVGNWNRNEYGLALKEKYSRFSNIHIFDPIYDLDKLYVLRANAACYIHGHSAGGTNPSLVEAMFFAKPILCYDVIYNRETTAGKAYYWNDIEALTGILQQSELNGEPMLELAERLYTWKHITAQYESLY